MLFDSLEKIGRCFKYVMLIVVSCVQCLVDIQPETKKDALQNENCSASFSVQRQDR